MKRKKKIPQNYMDIILVPQPELKWTTRKDGMVVLDMVNKGFFHKIAQTFFHRPRVSHIALDNYGTSVWKALDGKNTVYDVVCQMKELFPEEQDRMLDRVITFLHTLQENHFVTEMHLCEKENE
ncbi:MAG: PqqD family protein [Butyribacter sp.]|nr:PqqD family protein [bacterium]MDY3853641.1 PqqD family protein [Butyribacter sp.]